jgi:hypothetical protein
MFYAYVPSLFEALEAGKPAPVKPAAGSGFARVSRGSAPLSFSPESTMHSFTLSMIVRTQNRGTIAVVNAAALEGNTESKGRFESMTLTRGRPVELGLLVDIDNRWSYRSTGGGRLATITADSDWHHIVLSHFAARGETLFFVDGKLAGQMNERLEPTQFVIGGPGSTKHPAAPQQADYKDVLLFRAGLNADEVAALYEGKILNGSLEIYAPLADASFKPGGPVENRAQSLAAFQAGSDSMIHVTAP